MGSSLTLGRITKGVLNKMIRYIKANKVANELIKSLEKDGKFNIYGEHISKYFLLMEQEDKHEGNLKSVFVNITLENDWFKGDYYSVHCINQLANGGCIVMLTTSTQKGELIEVLKDIMARVLMGIHINNQEHEQEQNRMVRTA